MHWLKTVLSLTLVLSLWPLSVAAQVEANALLERLAQGGYVIYWRHATTDRRQRDQDLRDMDRCELQRNLNAAGREESRSVGAGLQARAIPIGQVLTSDFCRNRETAYLAFGRYERVPELWNLPAASAGTLDRQTLVSALQRHLGSQPADTTTNTVIVGHNLNLQAAASVRIGEGEIAIFRPMGQSQFEFLGRLLPADVEY